MSKINDDTYHCCRAQKRLRLCQLVAEQLERDRGVQQRATDYK